MDYFARSLANKVIKMLDFDLNGGIKDQNIKDSLSADEDLVIEQILENINNTSIGQVLKKIASLPDARQKKVLGVRRQLTEGQYDLNERLDVALDKVLEDLTT